MADKPLQYCRCIQTPWDRDPLFEEGYQKGDLYLYEEAADDKHIVGGRHRINDKIFRKFFKKDVVTEEDATFIKPDTNRIELFQKIKSTKRLTALFEEDCLMEIDPTSAAMVVAVYEALNDEHKKQFNAMPIYQMFEVTTQILAKQ